MKNRFAFLVLSCVITCTALIGFSQSGRRGAKSPSVPTPTPEEKQPEKKPEENLAKIPLFVGASRNDAFMGIPFTMYDAVLESCSQRLDDSTAVMVQPVTKGFSRLEAVERAKAETEGYVVWLHLRGDDLGSTYATNLDGVFIEYVVFEHTTAKVKASGNCYQGAYRKGGVVLGSPSSGSNRAVVENRLRAAAEDAADRILKALHFGVMQGPPSS